MTEPFTADELDAAYHAVSQRHPTLEGDALARKVRRVAAITRHSQDGTTWTAGRGHARRAGGAGRCAAGVPGCDAEKHDPVVRVAPDGIRVACQACPVCLWTGEPTPIR